MTTDSFQSSDSVRSSRPLKFIQHLELDTPLNLELGGRIQDVLIISVRWALRLLRKTLTSRANSRIGCVMLEEMGNGPGATRWSFFVSLVRRSLTHEVKRQT